jgi:GxxExxY protein
MVGLKRLQRRQDTAESAEKTRRTQSEIGDRVLGCALRVHKTLGPGLLESAYETCLAHDLRSAGLSVERQLTLPLVYSGITVDTGYRIDLLVEKLVVIEVKAVEALLDLHRAQLLSYLKFGGWRLGYLLNFNVTMMRNGISRMVLGL